MEKMKPTPALRRLLNQWISGSPARTPEEAVSRLVAIQGQDYPGAKYSIGLRVPGAKETAVDAAVEAGSVVRTWLFRGTLHLTAAVDVRKLQSLVAKRLIEGSAGRARNLGLDEAVYEKSRKLLVKALRGGNRLTREEVYGLLDKGGVSTEGQRGYHVLWRTAQEGLICFGPPSGKSQTFVLLDDWVPGKDGFDRAEVLADLARRYFTSRGPATLRDFVWWSGLTVREARAGLEAAAASLAEEERDGSVFWSAKEAAGRKAKKTEELRGVRLLPGFDEYLLGYRDRNAVLEPEFAERICPGSNGMFLATVVADGRVVGVWRKKTGKNGVEVEPELFRDLGEKEKQGLFEAAERYRDYLSGGQA